MKTNDQRGVLFCDMQKKRLLLVKVAKLRGQRQLLEPTVYMEKLIAMKILTNGVPGRCLFVVSESAQRIRSMNESDDDVITGAFDVGILFARKLWWQDEVVEHFLQHRHSERWEFQNPRRKTQNSVDSRGHFHRKSLRAARYVEHISQVGSNCRFSAAT